MYKCRRAFGFCASATHGAEVSALISDRGGAMSFKKGSESRARDAFEDQHENGQYVEEEKVPHGKLELVDFEAQKQEAMAMTEEERGFYDKAMAALTSEQRQLMTQDPLDGLVIVRGYSSFNPRLESTIKFMKAIAEWRHKVGYWQFFDGKLKDHEKFHTSWPNRVYGSDKYGHILTAFRLSDLNPDSLESIGQDQLERLQGQKMRCLYRYKADLSKQRGTQRYKHSAIIDMKGMTLSLMRGKKGEILKHLLDIGSHYYPEQMWKVYLVDCPMIFRGAWAIIKLWLHPVTVAKVNILGNAASAVKKMEQDGLPLASIPDWLGGQNKGMDMMHMVEQYLPR